jgi:hypothetical protein
LHGFSNFGAFNTEASPWDRKQSLGFDDLFWVLTLPVTFGMALGLFFALQALFSATLST